METSDGRLLLRQGRHVGRTLYRVRDDDADELVGLMDTAELAAAVVRAVNETDRTEVVEPS